MGLGIQSDSNEKNEITPLLNDQADLLGHIQAQPSHTDILVDFDETLFLRNSTEEYLDTLQPRILGYFFLVFLNRLKPWDWLSGSLQGSVSRDWLRVILSTIVFPWTPLLWRWRAKSLTRAQTNLVLLEALRQRSDCEVTIASLGFDFIVRPLAEKLPLPLKGVVACRFWYGGRDRAEGKRAMVQAVLSDRAIAQAMLITDSQDDAPLLSVVAAPCLFIWPEAAYIPAMSDIYIPFFYLEKVKKAGYPYFLKEVIGNDFAILILATSWHSAHPWSHCIAMALLLLSFLCVYEMGYMENDLIGERFEKKPTLSDMYLRHKQRINFWWPWVWSAGFALPGLFLLHWSDVLLFETSPLTQDWITLNLHATLGSQMLAWFAFLVIVRLFFSFYNHVDKYSRVWLYPVLQAFKSLGFLSVAATNVVGTLLFSATVLAYWLPYIIYRYTKKGWPEGNIAQLFRLVVFTFLIIAMAVGTADWSLLLSGQVLAIWAYVTWRSAGPLVRVVRSVKPVWSDQWGKEKSRS